MHISGGRVMVVEDVAITAWSMEESLKNLGYEVVAMADNGSEALEKARKTKPDVILMDICIKGPIDGIDTASAIRKELDIPVVYVTAHASRDVIDRARTTEPFGYVVKPFTDKDLLSNIEMALYKHRAEKEIKDANTRSKTLAGLLPICARCKKIRDDKGYWTKLEQYIHEHSDADFTHGLCPECVTVMISEAEGSQP